MDISKIDGASVLKDWHKDTESGKTLERAYRISCEHFSNILTPDSNEAHADHLHLDIGFGTGCLFK